MNINDFYPQNNCCPICNSPLIIALDSKFECYDNTHSYLHTINNYNLQKILTKQINIYLAPNIYLLIQEQEIQYFFIDAYYTDNNINNNINLNHNLIYSSNNINHLMQKISKLSIFL